MVDSIGSAGGPQNLQQGNRSQNNRAAETRRADGPQDSVEISSEAQALQSEQAALQAASQTRTILEQQIDQALAPSSEAVDQLL